VEGVLEARWSGEVPLSLGVTLKRLAPLGPSFSASHDKIIKVIMNIHDFYD
jgi:hypothetical protein